MQYDLEAYTLSADEDPLQRVQVRPAITFPVTKSVDLTTGLIYRINTDDRKDQYGIYMKVTFKTKEKEGNREK